MLTSKEINQMIAKNMELVKYMKHSEHVDSSSGLPDDMTREELQEVKEYIKSHRKGNDASK